MSRDITLSVSGSLGKNTYVDGLEFDVTCPECGCVNKSGSDSLYHAAVGATGSISVECQQCEEEIRSKFTIKTINVVIELDE
jgi:hypothetical protein